MLAVICVLPSGTTTSGFASRGHERNLAAITADAAAFTMYMDTAPPMPLDLAGPAVLGDLGVALLNFRRSNYPLELSVAFFAPEMNMSMILGREPGSWPG